jgi:hypothetical protein
MKKPMPLKAYRDDLPPDLEELLDELEREFEDSPNGWQVIDELRLCIDDPDFDNDLIQEMAENSLKHERARKAAAIHGLPSDLQRLLDQVEQEKEQYPRRESDVDELETNIQFGDFDSARDCAEKIIKRQRARKPKRKQPRGPTTASSRSSSKERLNKKEIELGEAILPICRRLAEKYSTSHIRLFYPDELGTAEVPTLGHALEVVADSVGPCFYPLYESRTPEEIDRLGGCVGSAPYVSADFPWPRRGRRYLVPWLQLDLDSIREATGVDVGDGLLQVWRENSDHAHTRHVLRASIDSGAKLVPMPRSVSKRSSLEGMFDSGDLRAPWQCTGWALAGLAVPENEEILVMNHDDWGGDLSVDEPDPRLDENGDPRFPLWDDEGEDEIAFRRALGKATRLRRQRKPETERPLADDHPDHSATVDCLFGFPDSEGEDYPDDVPQHCDLLGRGWRPLITISGPMDVEFFTDRCTVYFRAKGGSFEYTAKCFMNRRG